MHDPRPPESLSCAAEPENHSGFSFFSCFNCLYKTIDSQLHHLWGALFALLLIQTVSCSFGQAGLQRVVLQIEPLQILSRKNKNWLGRQQKWWELQPFWPRSWTASLLILLETRRQKDKWLFTHPELGEAYWQNRQLVVVKVQMLKSDQVPQVIWQTGQLVFTQVQLH